VPAADLRSAFRQDRAKAAFDLVRSDGDGVHDSVAPFAAIREERRRCVVGMTFEHRGDAEQHRVGNGLGHTLEKPETGNRCSRAAAETGRHRDVAFDLDVDRWRANTRPPGNRFEEPFDARPPSSLATGNGPGANVARVMAVADNVTRGVMTVVPQAPRGLRISGSGK